MSEQGDLQQSIEVSGVQPKRSMVRWGVLLAAGLSVLGGLSFGLMAAVQRAQESAARMA